MFKCQLFMCLALLCCKSYTQIVSSENNKPINVLFISVDDLRLNIGSYEDPYAKTPNIDKLANEGVLFKRAYCQFAVCAPSRSSALTGLYPDQIGVTNMITHFRKKRPNLVTLPQIFKNNGYHSRTIGKIFHGTKRLQDTMSLTKPPLLYQSIIKEQYVLLKNRKGGKSVSTEMTEVSDTTYWDGKIAQNTIKTLKEFKSSGEPFFLGVGFMKPHLPFNAPKKYWDMYDRDTIFQLKNRNRPMGAPDLAFHNSNELRGYTDIDAGEISQNKEKELWHGYYAATSYIDNQIGKVLDALDKLSMKDNTLIILWSDHGYHLGEQGFWCKSSNYELDVRVPLIFSHPKLSGGQHMNQIVELVDMYPTIIDICNLQAQTALSGASLLNMIKGDSTNWSNMAFNQFGSPYGGALWGKGLTHNGYSVRSDQYRLTLWFNHVSGEIDKRELYEMSEGIEKINISGNAEYVEVEKQLTALLLDYRNQKYMKNKMQP